MLGRRRTAHGSGLGTTRWVIERSLSWLHKFRKLRIRDERYPSVHEALLLLACCAICCRFLKG
jgi:transposase